ncbi:MAG: hypothetical protein ACI8QS_000658 [Planctomycetota bacterium]|jgi:hypothetical protein
MQPMLAFADNAAPLELSDGPEGDRALPPLPTPSGALGTRKPVSHPHARYLPKPPGKILQAQSPLGRTTANGY